MYVFLGCLVSYNIRVSFDTINYLDVKIFRIFHHRLVYFQVSDKIVLISVL